MTVSESDFLDLLTNLYKSLGKSFVQMKQRAVSPYSDQNGYIDWNEFVRFQNRSLEFLDEFWTMNLEDLRSEFQMLDINHDGKITEDEFRQVMRKLYHLSSSKGLEDFKAIVDKIKIEMSLTNPVSDLTTGSGPGPKERFVQQMMERFRKADVDHDGEITFSEFIRHEWTMNESLNSNSKTTNLKSLRREFQKLDLDGNGKISAAEFKKIITNVYDNMPQ